LPPEDPADNPEQRANRIRSFYKEYFDERCARRRCHRATGHRLGEWSNTMSGIIIVASNWVDFDESKNGQEPTYYEDFGPEFYEGGGNAGFIYDHYSQQSW
jgi:hypothetical protein